MGGSVSKRRLLQGGHTESSATPAPVYSVKLEVTQLEEYCTEENKLGEGGYGTVFKGKFTDIKSGQMMDVAIKRVQRISKAYKNQNNRHRRNLIILDEEFKFIAAERTFMKQHDNVLKCLKFEAEWENPNGLENWQVLSYGLMASL